MIINIKNIIFILFFFQVNNILAQKELEDKNSKRVVFLSEGQISLGYEYGFLPFLVSTESPQQNFKTEGYLGVNLFDLPFKASYYYSSLGTISGLNNHFSFKFDAQKYLMNKKEKLLKDRLSRLETIDSLNLERQSIKKKLDYLYLLEKGKVSLPNINGVVDNPLDTFSLKEPNIESLDIKVANNIEVDTSIIEVPIPNLENRDTLKHQIEKYEQLVATYESQIENYKKYGIGNVDSLTNYKQLKKRKLDKYLGGIKAFEIGLTYPNYSKFLVAKIPIRGLNVEYEFNNIYLAFSHGKTVNNIFFTNNIIQNNLNAGRNLYNFFDFNNVEDGRKVTALKLGYGKKESSHLFIGGLKGLGKISYLDTTDNNDLENNIVGELDLRLKYKKKHILDVFYGRSALQTNIVNNGEEAHLFDKLLSLEERTNAIYSKYSLNLKSTKLTLGYRYVDPYFKSFGLGFMRSDNIRYELKIKQKVGKKINIGGYFRRENDNLLGLYSYQNIIKSYGVNVMYRPTKSWMFKTDIRPIVQNVQSELDSLSIENRNYIANFILSYNKRKKETYFIFTAIYSYYQLSSVEGINNYQNYNANFSVQYKDKITNDFIFNHYVSSDTVSVPVSSLIQDDLSFKFNKFSLTFTGKMSLGQQAQVDVGYGLRCLIRVNKNLSVEAASEKLVLGDFYNNYLNNGITNYPYYSSLTLRLKW